MFGRSEGVAVQGFSEISAHYEFRTELQILIKYYNDFCLVRISIFLKNAGALVLRELFICAFSGWESKNK